MKLNRRQSILFLTALLILWYLIFSFVTWDILYLFKEINFEPRVLYIVLSVMCYAFYPVVICECGLKLDFKKGDKDGRLK